MNPLYLLDTNILLRDTDTAGAQHGTARAALLKLAGDGAPLFVTPQVLIEFWAVASRPTKDNGLALGAPEIERRIAAYLAAFDFAPDTAAIFEEWRRLANTYTPQGKPTHDARLVAAMKVHGLTHILTFNAKDFRRYEAGENILVIEPASVK